MRGGRPGWRPAYQPTLAVLARFRVEVISLPTLDPYQWLVPEHPLRCVFAPALKGGDKQPALEHALALLKAGLTETNYFAAMGLLVSLAEQGHESVDQDGRAC